MSLTAIRCGWVPTIRHHFVHHVWHPIRHWVRPRHWVRHVVHHAPRVIRVRAVRWACAAVVSGGAVVIPGVTSGPPAPTPTPSLPSAVRVVPGGGYLPAIPSYAPAGPSYVPSWPVAGLPYSAAYAPSLAWPPEALGVLLVPQAPRIARAPHPERVLTPEPSSLWLLGAGLVIALAVRGYRAWA